MWSFCVVESYRKRFSDDLFFNRAGHSRLSPYWFYGLVPNDSNELFILSHNVIGTAEMAVVSFMGFHPTKTHLELEGVNYYADKL